MPNNISTLKPMKSTNLNIRLEDDVRPVVDYLKLLPGGVTKWVHDRLREVKVDKDLLKKLEQLK
jgi:hypothetical protein